MRNRVAPDISPNAVTLLYKDPPNLSATKGNASNRKSNASREYSNRRAGPKEHAAGQYVRWSKKARATEARQPPRPAPKRSRTKEEEIEAAASPGPEMAEKRIIVKRLVLTFTLAAPEWLQHQE